MLREIDSMTASDVHAVEKNWAGFWNDDLPFTGNNNSTLNYHTRWARSVQGLAEPGIAVFENPGLEMGGIDAEPNRQSVMGPLRDERQIYEYNKGLPLTTYNVPAPGELDFGYENPEAYTQPKSLPPPGPTHGSKKELELLTDPSKTPSLPPSQPPVEEESQKTRVEDLEF
jgi:hypothetical protein